MATLLTHPQFRDRYRAAGGVCPTECTGIEETTDGDYDIPLMLVEQFDDDFAVYHCAVCGASLSFDLQAEQVLNDYRPPKPVRLIRPDRPANTVDAARSASPEATPHCTEP